ncbi:MAG: UDP-N-acetylmuramoyl-L-alanine--D-glutamate ligase [Aerococcaceae bacterium]|nr:UDP-N-acetylmuramoyl-L-alanine--D-glutamate ligase [Aerococcaceae bacterium]
MNLNNQQVLVMGFGLTGKSVANFLVANGAQVTVIDRGDVPQDPSVHLLLQKGVQFIWGEHPLELLETPFAFIVKNPGIKYTVPFVQAAMERGIPIYTDVELAYRFSKAPIIGITGSNGKTTTTSLMHQLLQHRQNGQAFLAGNIGIPTLDVVPNATQEDVIVMELSSFQLEGTEQFTPSIAVMTNIFDAHADYHGSHEAYVAAKFKLLKNLTSQEFVVFNYDSVPLKATCLASLAQKVPFSIDNVDDFVRENGAYVENESVYFQGEKVAEVADILIPGKHNVENALAALAVAKLHQVPNAAIVQVLRTYTGMPHRIQKIAESNGRLFYNDSKATNETATNTALDSFKQPTHYIGGGLDRGGGFDELIPHLTNVTAAYLYGQSKEKMQRTFQAANVPQIQLFETLVEATTAAYHNAKKGEVVLLSPSCASWDQFANFEERGNTFEATVRHLLATDPYKENDDERN